MCTKKADVGKLDNPVWPSEKIPCVRTGSHTGKAEPKASDKSLLIATYVLCFFLNITLIMLAVISMASRADKKQKGCKWRTHSPEFGYLR